MLKGVFVVAILGVLLSLVSFRSRISGDGRSESYRLPDPPEFTGALAPNEALASAEYLLENELIGPESILVEGDVLYATVSDGRLVRVEGGKVTREWRLGRVPEKGCGGYDEEDVCGRPLGLRRLNERELVVVDAYLGVFAVDVEAKNGGDGGGGGGTRRLIDARVPVEGQLPRFLNDVDVLSPDELFITDSSTAQRRDFMVDLLQSAGLGRVLHHKISTGETTVMLSGLHFANGIQMMPDRQSFVVAELTRARIIRYWLAGPKKGASEVFVDNLPGPPDNIRLSTNGTLWVGLGGVRQAGKWEALSALSEWPSVRDVLVQTLPDFVLRDVLRELAPKYGLVIQLDLNGRIVSSLHDTKGARVREVSQVTDGGDYLYLGSFKSPFIARIKKF